MYNINKVQIIQIKTLIKTSQIIQFQDHWFTIQYWIPANEIFRCTSDFEYLANRVPGQSGLFLSGIDLCNVNIRYNVYGYI